MDLLAMFVDHGKYPLRRNGKARASQGLIFSNSHFSSRLVPPRTDGARALREGRRSGLLNCLLTSCYLMCSIYAKRSACRRPSFRCQADPVKLMLSNNGLHTSKLLPQTWLEPYGCYEGVWCWPRKRIGAMGLSLQSNRARSARRASHKSWLSHHTSAPAQGMACAKERRGLA